MRLRPYVTLAATAIVLSTIAGCGQSPAATGQVTFDGQPVEKGEIVFQPADGQGPSCGAPITKGQYRLEITPGKKKVNITGMKGVPFDKNDPQQAAFAAAAAKNGDTSGLYYCVDPRFGSAEGNHVEVEVKTGTQTLDFALKSK